MSKTVLKNTKDALVVKIVNEANSSIALSEAQFTDNDSTITPTELVISEVYLSGGTVVISRNSVDILYLEGPIELNDLDFNFTEELGEAIDITSSDAYTLIISMKKNGPRA